jgi:putative glutamine amidotransferase
VHAVQADSGTLASRALAGAVEVNSIHHQAVGDPGPELVATAWSADGVIEAVEGAGALGLQWHPERLLDFDRRHLAPFRWLVSAR